MLWEIVYSQRRQYSSHILLFSSQFLQEIWVLPLRNIVNAFHLVLTIKSCRDLQHFVLNMIIEMDE